MEEIEVLFEYKGSNSSVKCVTSELEEALSSKLESFGYNNFNGLILQRYSAKWNCFVDCDVKSVINGDKLTVIPDPKMEKGSEKTAENILARVKKPTEAESKVLAKYFPSSRGSSSKKFDPVAESIVLPRQMKKKAAIVRERTKSISVVMMDEYVPVIPKGKARERLATKGQILSLKFTRLMKPEEVKSKILKAFVVDEFIVLDCNGTGHGLVKCADQVLDGEKAVNRKGALYLCKKFTVVRIAY